MEKMIAIYRQNPALGDEKAVSQSLEETLVKVDEQNAVLYKFKVSTSHMSSSMCLMFELYHSKICVIEKSHTPMFNFGMGMCLHGLWGCRCRYIHNVLVITILVPLL